MLHKTWVAIRFRAKKPSPQTTRNFALVCLWCGRTVGRSVYGHVITKFSRMGSLHIFLPMVLRYVRLARESSAKIKTSNAEVVFTCSYALKAFKMEQGLINFTYLLCLTALMW